jgi:TRAP-type C4-dicarboxylate transport system permease small subunit
VTPPRPVSTEDRLYRLPEAVAAIDLLLLMALVATDVAGRYLLNRPVPGAYELVQLLMGVLVFSALPVVSRRNEHITLGLLDPHFRGAADRFRRVAVNAFSAAVLAFVAWRLGEHALKLARNGDRTAVLALPLAPIGFFATAMASLAVIALVILSVRAARRPPR